MYEIKLPQGHVIKISVIKVIDSPLWRATAEFDGELPIVGEALSTTEDEAIRLAALDWSVQVINRGSEKFEEAFDSMTECHSIAKSITNTEYTIEKKLM